ncbi:Fe-S cluster-containing hydrogenase component 1 [Pyrolobus fumarii 1A]|uniref:Fe-S cluster-containing hydrogenase component 1 n=1 Tax=Pyrolobus fumarii (strain DSM 11204 / 1A) TaxID=694429 RepID=G0EF54_PYRF1|nr:4Fe-4S dicluster domain-containing protein [Pyrolobus fumarii]AEM38951.1 Fe-S cluster-containing hydrogenase component 1 [Pyrolobus fumarii 1A]
MARYGMVIDLNRCIGCLACVVACIRENIARQTGEDVVYPEPPVLYARTKPVHMKGGESLPFSDTTVFIQCQHCENPPCAMVCPTGATFVDEYGVVRLDHNKCIGCRACMIACPYAARTMYRGSLPGEPPNKYGLVPNTPDKCTFCVHRREAGNWVPACVEACAFGARMFGDLDDDKSEVARIVRSGTAVQLLSGLGCDPKLFYVPPLRSALNARR